MSIRQVWITSVILTMLGLALVLIQHWGMMLSNADDPWIAQLGYSSGVVQGSMDAAKLQGRFGFIPVLTIAQWPYLLDSWEFVNSLKIIVNGLVFLSFVLFCSKLINKYAGLLMGLVWLALIDINSSSYSAIHGFLLFFNLQFCFFFASLYVFLDRLEKNKTEQIIIAPYLLFAFSLLAYEPMIFYAMVFPALYVYKKSQGSGTESKISIVTHAQRFLSQNYMLAIVVVLYLICYVGFKKLYATGGQSIDLGASWSAVVKTIVNFSIHGFHVQLKPFAVAVLEQHSQANLIIAVVFGVILVLAMFLIIPRIEGDLIAPNLYKPQSLFILGFFILSPNILYGFVEGYRKWANYDPHYVGNYFSSFPLAMGIALLVLYLVGGEKFKRERILFLLVIYVFFSSAVDNYLRWEQLAGTNRNESVLWQKAIHDLSRQKFDSQHQTLICTNNAPKHVSGDDKYWSQYLSGKFSSDIQFISNRVSLTSCDVIIDFQKG